MKGRSSDFEYLHYLNLTRSILKYLITSAELDQLILRLVRNLNITFVVVTHELPSIYTIVDRVIMLDKRVKGIVATGKPQELRDHSSNPWVRQFFNREAELSEAV